MGGGRGGGGDCTLGGNKLFAGRRGNSTTGNCSHFSGGKFL